MIEKKKIVKEIERTVAYVCDVCKERYDGVIEMQEFVHIHFVGGYGSVFGDSCEYRLDMCQHCAKKLLVEHLRCVRDPVEDFLSTYKEEGI